MLIESMVADTEYCEAVRERSIVDTTSTGKLLESTIPNKDHRETVRKYYCR